MSKSGSWLSRFLFCTNIHNKHKHILLLKNNACVCNLLYCKLFFRRTKRGVNMYDNANSRMRVKRFMFHYGANRRHLAKNMGINYTAFAGWLSGNREFGASLLRRINKFIDEVQKIAI